MTKRLFDLCAAILGLLVSLPVLLVVAIAVKLDSPRPVLFTPVRVGRGGRPFRVFKFRSMFADSDRGSAITSGVDHRVARVGRIIPTPRIDELPQLLNVLMGNMSLVGPKPAAQSIVERYTAEPREVLDVGAGVTEPTQPDSPNEAARLPADAEPTDYYVRPLLSDKLAADLDYIKTRTFGGDLRILLRTPVCLGRFLPARTRFSRLPKITRRRSA
jgi:lipopolysaccharide/colanic/teichoic acid biosynthesis glycosyltransferase